MTLRLRIARWLAPELAAKEIADEAHIHALRTNLRKAGWDREAAREALSSIASCETPNASHTVKKMARIAKEALG